MWVMRTSSPTKLDEYVATEHILEELETMLDTYQESINNPNETCTVWVSGFFGSGKSSWAKVLGYLLWNPIVVGEPAADRFFGRTSAPHLQALLNTIHAQAPTLASPAESGNGVQCRGQGGRVHRPTGLPGFTGPARLLPQLHDRRTGVHHGGRWETTGFRERFCLDCRGNHGRSAATPHLPSATP